MLLSHSILRLYLRFHHSDLKFNLSLLPKRIEIISYHQWLHNLYKKNALPNSFPKNTEINSLPVVHKLLLPSSHSHLCMAGAHSGIHPEDDRFPHKVLKLSDTSLQSM